MSLPSRRCSQFVSPAHLHRNLIPLFRILSYSILSVSTRNFFNAGAFTLTSRKLAFNLACGSFARTTFLLTSRVLTIKLDSSNGLGVLLVFQSASTSLVACSAYLPVASFTVFCFHMHGRCWLRECRNGDFHFGRLRPHAFIHPT